MTLSSVTAISSIHPQKTNPNASAKVCVRIFQYGAQLATDPREANASACTAHEPPPEGVGAVPFLTNQATEGPAHFPTVHWTVGTGRDADRPDVLFSSPSAPGTAFP